MNKLKFATLIAATIPSMATAKPFTAKNAAQGFTGVTGDFSNVLFNPALLANHQKNDNFLTSFGAGILVSNPDEMIDTIDNAQDLMDRIDGKEISIDERDELISILDELNNNTISAEAGVQLFSLIPTDSLKIGISINNETKIAGQFTFDENDRTLLYDLSAVADTYETWEALSKAEKEKFTGFDDWAKDATVLQKIWDNFDPAKKAKYGNDIKAWENAKKDAFDKNQLKSSATLVGYAVSEAALTLAQNINLSNGDLSLGANIKYQRVDVFDYMANVASFDGDDFEIDDYLTDDAQINLDLGAQYSWGENRQWQVGLVAKNLNSFDIHSTSTDASGAPTTKTASIDPQVTAGVSYDNQLMRVAFDLDLVKHNAFTSLLEENQFASLGVEFDAWQWAQIRAGYRKDLKSNSENLITAGFGLSPFDTVSLDVSGLLGSEDTVGGVVQLGIKF